MVKATHPIVDMNEDISTGLNGSRSFFIGRVRVSQGRIDAFGLGEFNKFLDTLTFRSNGNLIDQTL